MNNKFRVWNKDEYISFSNAIYWNLVGVEHEDEANELKPFEEGVIIEQWTGLKDKNGVEIYEGDIFDIHQTVNGCNLFEVVWNDIGWSAKYAVNMVKPRLYEYDLKELFDVNYNEKYPYEIEIEVVGNIHEGVKND